MNSIKRFLKGDFIFQLYALLAVGSIMGGAMLMIPMERSFYTYLVGITLMSLPVLTIHWFMRWFTSGNTNTD